MKAFQISACIGGYGYLKLKSNFVNSHFCWLHWLYFSLRAQARKTMPDFHNYLYVVVGEAVYGRGRAGRGINGRGNDDLEKDV